jgi:hypothetical protein
VKPGGNGISIQPDGTIEFNSESCEGVVKTNNPTAYNSYVWPNSIPTGGGALTLGTGGILSWNPVPSSGLGLGLDGEFVKVSIPILPLPPDVGNDENEAMVGSLYFNSSSKGLYIRSTNQWEEVSQTNIIEQLLTGVYHLYVDTNIGEDTYIQDLTDQELVCGYTPQKPFKTLSRASIEVARIQQGVGFNPLIYDRVVIHVAVGSFNVINGKGSASVSPWVDGEVPTDSQLQSFNSPTKGGLILPRGVSVIGEDLRKTVIRPTFVPSFSGNYETDRAAIFRITGGAFFFNFTFKDKEGYTESHHLLDCFSFVSEAELQAYYVKIQQAFALASTPSIANPGETEIVAPLPNLSPTSDTDGSIGSSPYIFNCSVRSLYGLCGINADGNEASGFKSMVVAQFTGVSLQKDLRCWQRYDAGANTWISDITSYDSGPNNYISLPPNDIRMDKTKISYHVRALNNAFIQEVSVFAIGQGIHHWCLSGSDISITNSNSSFGGCAGISEGYKNFAFAVDKNWNVSGIKVRVNLNTSSGNEVKKIYLGQITGNPVPNTLSITLSSELVDSEDNPGIPLVLDKDGYTLRPGSYLWIENPDGRDFRAPLATNAWLPNVSKSIINVSSAFFNEEGLPPDNISPLTPALEGLKVYVRRVIDNKSLDERTFSLILSSTDTQTRTPLRDYVVQAPVGNPLINYPFPATTTFLIGESANIIPSGSGVVKRAEVTLRRGNPNSAWASARVYREGDNVRYLGKHYTCIQKNSDVNFDGNKWDESFVHMPSEYNAEDYYKNSSPFIIFDNDTDDIEDTTNCGYNFNTVWETDEKVFRQLSTATDYRGVFGYLKAIGFTDVEANKILMPRTVANRYLDPASSIDMKGYSPNGVANSLGNWPLELRRPSTMRMFGHAWEWAGFLNYTKAIPQYQKELSPQNKFTYFFTNVNGGRVYGSGFNEEGFLVTPQGIQDLTTGAVIGTDQLGGNTTVNQPNSYDNLLVNNLTVNQSATFSGNFESLTPIIAPNVYLPGLGLFAQNGSLKLSVPISEGPPIISDSPSGAREGSLYWDKALGCLFIRYNDGDSIQWVQAVPSAPGIAPSSEPVTLAPSNQKKLYRTSGSVGSLVRVNEGAMLDNITEVAPPDRPNDLSEAVWDGSEFEWVYYPQGLTLNQAKSYVKGKLEAKKMSLLEPTNFAVMESMETGGELDEMIMSERNRIREWFSSGVEKIMSAKNKDFLDNVLTELSSSL